MQHCHVQYIWLPHFYSDYSGMIYLSSTYCTDKNNQEKRCVSMMIHLLNCVWTRNLYLNANSHGKDDTTYSYKPLSGFVFASIGSFISSPEDMIRA